MHNTTLRVAVTGEDRLVILRFAPHPERQFHSERALMRDEFATLPYLAPIAPPMPRSSPPASPTRSSNGTSWSEHSWMAFPAA
jgi:hypothetical protein